MMGNVSSMDHAALAMSLAGRLQDGGTPDHLARLFSVVPRHRFLPDVYWTEDRTRVDRTQDPGTWSRTAYTDQALTTQRDDGAKTGPGIASSSSSAPSVMARMLTAARIEPGMRVLEVGTGTGYNSALLSELVESRNVATVEIDPHLAECARGDLYAAGYTPDVIVGDGEYATTRYLAHHRIIATCTVSVVPWQWLGHLYGHGRIVTPWAPTPGAPGGVLAVLDMVTPTLAEGRFEGPLSFMWARGQRWPTQPVPPLDARAEHIETTGLDPRKPWLDGETALLLSLLCPGWTYGMRMETEAEDLYVWLASTSCESWARLHADGRIEQSGRRLLANEARTAWQWWESQGSPEVADFGLSVDRGQGRQSVWLYEPENIMWSTRRA